RTCPSPLGGEGVPFFLPSPPRGEGRKKARIPHPTPTVRFRGTPCFFRESHTVPPKFPAGVSDDSFRGRTVSLTPAVGGLRHESHPSVTLGRVPRPRRFTVPG